MASNNKNAVSEFSEIDLPVQGNASRYTMVQL